MASLKDVGSGWRRALRPRHKRPSDNPEGYRSPAEKGLEFEDVNLTTEDGLRIHCWFIPAPGDDKKARAGSQTAQRTFRRTALLESAEEDETGLLRQPTSSCM